MSASDLYSLLPLRGVVITLEALSHARLNFFHQPALTAFLRFLLSSPGDYDTLIRIDAPESGRVRYRKGDYYRFVIFALAGGEALLDSLLLQLSRLPASAPKQDKNIPFRDNWCLVSVQDVWSEQTLHSLADASYYDIETLQQEAALWCDAQQFGVDLVTPARLLKDKAQRVDAAGNEPKSDALRFVRDESELTAALWWSRLHNAVADLVRRRNGSSIPLTYIPDFQILRAHLFWLDAHYRGEQQSKDMGGVTGKIAFVLPHTWSRLEWEYAVLGQYIGIGQRPTFGWGRYILRSEDGGQSYRRVHAANSFLLLAQEEENLAQAWRHIMAGRDEADDIEDELRADWVEVLEQDIPVTENEAVIPDFPLERLRQGLEQLFWGKYDYPLLTGYLIPKKNGGVRPLAIPPVQDRILQRAVQQVLTESLDTLMSERSHGYRAGHSRITASQAIQTAWREGFRWVYEGDIHDFFDSVSWQRLRERLEALFPSDPVIDAILGWMQMTVHFQNEVIERQQGLPQGSPLSPLMANLLLDDFDSDMEAAGFRMIRFADDFVVLCKSPEQAQVAKERAASSLQEHGLALHPDKSHITDMADGFRYLGYLFVNDMALDVSGAASPSDSKSNAIPAQSWLAQLGERHAERAQSEQALVTMVERVQNQQALNIGMRERSGSFVIVTGEPMVLSTLHQQLNAYRKDQCVLKLPWNSIESVLLLGNHQITTQAMHEALERDIPIHLANSLGYYRGCITHNRNSQYQAVWMQQVLAFQDDEKALYCAKEVIIARVRHIKEVLRQRKLAASVPVIDKALREIPQVAAMDTLLGYEGSATREYYAKLAEILPVEFAFQGRNRQPPRDPFNVLLSLGYTQLYALVESVLHVKGLLPWQGFYHRPRGRHAALALDLMEPFRHFVERAALSMVLRGELTVHDFSMSAGACHIEDKARRKYLALLLQNWEVSVTARGEAEPRSWLEHMQRQAQSLKNFVTKGEPFHAFRLR